MKQVPSSLHRHEFTENALRFHGTDRTLTVTELAAGVLEIRYDFGVFPVTVDQERAAALLYDERRGADSRRERDGFVRNENNANPNEITFRWGVHSIRVGTDSGDLALYRGERLIHGGRVGSDDTVLPRYPLRIHGTPPNHVLGSFNFPLDRSDRFFGLGDKTGGVDRRGRRFLMHNRDALGYRGSFADPLYKSIPFLIKQNPENDTCIGIAFSAPDVAAIDLGVESEYYYSATVRNGPYRYVLFTGDSYAEVLERYTYLSGRPAFPPLFTFGFLGSSMDYSEPDDARDRINAYLDTVEQLDIPCEGLYLSSGYYRAENGQRYTFEWNHKKFPDPHGFLTKIRERGYHVACNVKPGILTSHPRFHDFAENGALLKNTDGSVYTEYYWGGDAGLWDFGSEEGRQMWRHNLREMLLDPGFDGVWNDNNEFEIEDSSLPAYSQRHTMSLVMSKTSWEESIEKDPERRPWIITRSGTMGIQRYARTWSGDNVSSWESLYYNIVMGSSFGLSGMPFFGHDIGGFFGPRPDAEQFVRWCQSAVFQPRFVIHSWNDDATPTELWSYEGIADDLRELVLQHYEFMPYTYSFAWHAHRTGYPIQRHPYVEFPNDQDLHPEDAMYLYGDSILVALPVEPGTDRVAYRLPRGTRWYDPESETRYDGGTVISKTVPTQRVPYIVKDGAIIPRAPGVRSLSSGVFPVLEIDLFPGDERSEFTLYEDDGDSRIHLRRWCETQIRIEPERSGGWTVTTTTLDTNRWDPEVEQSITFILPPFLKFENSDSPSVAVSRTQFRAGWSARITGLDQ